MKHKVKWLKGHENKSDRIYEVIDPWINKVSDLYFKLTRDEIELPFHESEMTAVSLMSSAALQAGYRSMVECRVDKKGKYGRVDLWFTHENFEYWFECKSSVGNPCAKRFGLDNSLAIAQVDIRKIDEWLDNEFGFSVVISADRNPNEEKTKIYLEFCKKVDFAVHIGPNDHRGVYLFFKSGICKGRRVC